MIVKIEKYAKHSRIILSCVSRIDFKFCKKACALWKKCKNSYGLSSKIFVNLLKETEDFKCLKVFKKSCLTTQDFHYPIYILYIL